MVRKSSTLRYTLYTILVATFGISIVKAQQPIGFVQPANNLLKEFNIRLQLFDLPVAAKTAPDSHGVVSFRSGEQGERYAVPLDKEMPETYKGKPVYKDSKGAKYVVGANYKKYFIR